MIDGRRVNVSEEVYREFKYEEDKECYFMWTLKKGHIEALHDREELQFIISREQSYELLLENDWQFRKLESPAEDAVIQSMLEEYFSLKSGCEKKITNSMKRIQELENGWNKFERQAEELKNFAGILETVGENEIFTKEMTDKLIESITVNALDSIRIHFRFEDSFRQIGSDG